FFQAEDGIRAFHVTGVQTCALPILPKPSLPARRLLHPNARIAGGAYQPHRRHGLPGPGIPTSGGTRCEECPVQMVQEIAEECEEKKPAGGQDGGHRAQPRGGRSTYRRTTRPMRSSSPSWRRSRRTGAPFLSVPLVVCRSSTHHAPPSKTKRAWRRETRPSASCKSFSSERPTAYSALEPRGKRRTPPSSS